MKAYRTNNLLLDGYTLVELLVVMIITSILLLTVFDGLSLFRRYSKIISDKLGNNIELNNKYYMLESIIEHSDTLTEIADGEILIFRDGREYGILSLRDSVMSITIDDHTDSLFLNITELRCAKRTKEQSNIDTIYFSIAHRNAEFPQTISLSPEQSISSSLSELINEIEKNYVYE